MTQITQLNTKREGNTKPLSKPHRSRRWCLTLNNFTKVEKEKLIISFNTHNTRYIVGEEYGEKEKTPHLQIYIEYKNPTLFSTIKNYNSRLHIEIAKGNKIENLKY